MCGVKSEVLMYLVKILMYPAPSAPTRTHVGGKGNGFHGGVEI